MTVLLRLFALDGTSEDITDILSFTFSKDFYTPYTKLSAVFKAGTTDTFDCKSALLFVNGQAVHQGFIDTFKTETEGGFVRCSLASRGYTSLYSENQLVPGLYTNISINSLMEDYVYIPYADHENLTDPSYIYVKSGSNIWDGIVNAAYKLYGKYPYVRGCNYVMVNRYPTARGFTYSTGEILSKGSELDTRKMASFFSMADINDNYGSYTYTEQEAVDRDIVRERYFQLDRRFLYAPQQAVEFRDKMSVRGFRKEFFTYSGYKGEDLFDWVTAGGQNTDITSVKITGSSKGIFTEIGAYKDKFANTAS